MRFIRISFTVICLCLVGAIVHAAAPQPKKILVITSYHLGNAWSDGEIMGFANEIEHRLPEGQCSYEFLDWVRHRRPEREEIILRDIIDKHFIGQTPPDLIVSIDDPAFTFVSKYRAALGGERIPWVFCGINDLDINFRAPGSNCTGIGEGMNFEKNLNLILRFHPRTKTLYVAHDQAQSSLISRRRFETVAKQFSSRLDIRYITNFTQKSLLEALEKLPPDSVVMNLGVYLGVDGEMFGNSAEFHRELTRRCPVPIYRNGIPLNPIFNPEGYKSSDWGSIGGYVISNVVHGNSTAKLAIRVLRGENPDSIPLSIEMGNLLILDYRELQRFSVNKALIPPEAVIHFAPSSHYSVSRTELLTGISILFLAIGVATILLINTALRRKAEKALKQSNERFNLSARATDDGLWDWNVASGEVWTNECLSRLLNLPDLPSTNWEIWERCIHQEDRLRVMTELRAAMADPAVSNWSAEYRVNTANGKTGHILNRAYFVREPGKNPHRVIGAIVDFTDSKHTEQELIRLASAIAQSTDLVLFLSMEGLITYANPAFEKVSKFETSDALDKPYDFCRTPETTPLSFVEIKTAIELNSLWSGRINCTCRTGETIQLQTTISPIRNTRGEVVCFVQVGRDVTRETLLEEQVRLGQKMEAIALLAGGVAHDFNNLLQVIQGFTIEAKEPTTSVEDRDDCLNQVFEASKRAADLTRQLLIFGRRQPMQITDITLNEVASDLIRMIRRLIGENIEIDLKSAPEIGNIHGDRTQIEQVLMNLCINARDAMPKGGHLVIRLNNVDINEGYCKFHPWAKPGNYVQLSVSDNGIGMDKTTLVRIFDPFFSTKQRGKGTGLGLAVVYSIVQQHNGFIHVYSEPDKGTVFKLFFPTAKSSGIATENKVTPERVRGTGTILLAEDEDAVRQISVRILERAGYKVIQACNGNEAITCFDENAARIDMAILDAIMPGKTGAEVSTHITSANPRIPILYCSGYSSDTLTEDFTFGHDIHLLQKPFAPNDLLIAVQNILTKSRSGTDQSGEI